MLTDNETVCVSRQDQVGICEGGKQLANPLNWLNNQTSSNQQKANIKWCHLRATN
jgi:hypothetical protein